MSDPATPLEGQEEFLLRLLFDAELRARMAQDREATLAGECPPAAVPLFRALDLHGLELDALSRQEYLMSALCRSHPIGASCIGAQAGGRDRLLRFLATPALFAPVAERTRSFGRFLQLTLEGLGPTLPPALLLLIQPFLDLECAQAENAQALRLSVEAGHPPPAGPVEYSGKQLKRGLVALPPHFLAAELPVPSSILTTALHHVSAENAWHRIRSGDLQVERLMSVARGPHVPVTVLARALTTGQGIERAGAGGVSPVVHVKHLYLELSGRRRDLFPLLDGTRTLGDFPSRLESLLKNLIRGGFLILQ